MNNKNILCINADLQSTNLGCAALGLAFVQMLKEIANEENMHIDLSIIGYGYARASEDESVTIHQTIYFDIKKFNFWKQLNHCIRKADLIIDFTGGDSFTDIYGLRRFIRESIVKEVAIDSKSCFVLGPQTIGPFENKFVKKVAKHLILKSDYVFTRDEISNLYALNLGCKSILTTDVAFMLKPSVGNYDYLKKTDKLKIGFNVSGLMMNGGYSNNNQFGLKMDYKYFVNDLIKQCVNLDYEIHLIPHVLPLHSPTEDDYRSAELLHNTYPETVVAPRFSSPIEAKEYIGNMDFFVGSRMHATIASFSMCVPTIPVAYSPKFSRLFSSVGYDRVIDCKDTSESEAVDIIINCILNREKIKTEMAKSLELIKIRNYDFKNKIRNILIK